MTGTDHRHSARISVLVTGVLVALVAALPTSVLAFSSDAPLTAGIAMLAVAAAALVRTTTGGFLVLRSVTRPDARQPAPCLSARVADPVRHPARPRAPGTV